MKSVKSDAECIRIQQMVYAAHYDGREVNSFKPHKESKTTVREDGIVYINDISYGSQYPNGFFDIWYPDTNLYAKRPTLVYFHGGGFLFGDKVEGDPLAVSVDDGSNLLLDLVRRGFNLINANYALAPDYRFPIQIHQVNELMRFLQANKDQYGLNMDDIVLMGGSAGADMTAMYGLVLTDEDYADALNIKPNICKEQVKVLVIDEAALSLATFNEAMHTMLDTWMGEELGEGSNLGVLMNVAAWIKEPYLPSFINTSNMEPWFVDSAKELRDALEKQGTAHEYFYRDTSIDQLEHGYMGRFAYNACARECYEHMLAFVEMALANGTGEVIS